MFAQTNVLIIYGYKLMNKRNVLNYVVMIPIVLH